MKKTFLISIILLFALVAGCAHNASSPTKSASPISDFRYEENEESSITITRYIGLDANVIIPTEIEGKVVTQIGKKAFGDNKAIKSVEIPDSVTLIAQGAFANCDFLSTVSLPQNLKVMDDGVFLNCTSLSAITLPNTLKYIKEGTFANCSMLKHINMPGSITEIHEYAFLNSGIETIDFEEGLSVIGPHAFAHTNMREVVLPPSVKKIETDAFGDCTQLESVVLNDGLISIGPRAFGNPSKLTKLVIPASVTDISETFCYYNNSLRVVKFEGNAPQNYRTETTALSVKPLKENGYMNYTVYYHEGATGFTSPEWCGYPTEIW